MDNTITQAIQVPPGDFGMRLRVCGIRLVGELTHLTEVKNTRFHDYGVFTELVIG